MQGPEEQVPEALSAGLLSCGTGAQHPDSPQRQADPFLTHLKGFYSALLEAVYAAESELTQAGACTLRQRQEGLDRAGSRSASQEGRVGAVGHICMGTKQRYGIGCIALDPHQFCTSARGLAHVATMLTRMAGSMAAMAAASTYSSSCWRLSSCVRTTACSVAADTCGSEAQ